MSDTPYTTYRVSLFDDTGCVFEGEVQARLTRPGVLEVRDAHITNPFYAAAPEGKLSASWTPVTPVPT